MPNPYHFRAKIDGLWRTANSSRPGYIRLNALDTVARELYRPTDKARQNLKMYLATDPYEVAQHKLRHLHDVALALPSPPADLKVAPAKAGAGTTSKASLPLPLPLGEGRGEGSPPEEDDDPL